MAPDVVSFAVERGYWAGAADDASFSFSDTYDAVTPSGARFCEARVWSVFARLADPASFDAARYRPRLCAGRRRLHPSGQGTPEPYATRLLDREARYLDYAQGFNLTNRMPLFVRAKPGGVSRAEMHAALSDHFEGGSPRR